MSFTPLFFLIIFFACNLLALMRSPVYGVIGCVFLYFMNPGSTWWYSQVPDLRYALIAVLVLLVSYLVRIEQYKQSRLLEVPHLRVLLLLMVAVLASTLWAVDPVNSLKLIVQWMKVCIFVFLAYKVVRNSEELDWVLVAYCFGCFYAGFCAWEFGGRISNRMEVIKLADGTDGNGVAIALLLSVPILFFYLFWGKRLWLRISSLATLAFVVNSLVLINSRGAFLGLIGSLGLFALRVIFEKKDLGLAVKVVLAGLLFFGCLLYLGDEAFWTRMGSLRSPNLVQESIWDEPVTDLRTEFWWKSFDILADHPLGTGAGGYEALSAQYLPAEWLSGGKRAVHSTWFEVLTNFGYQGLLLYVGYLLFGFRELRMARISLRAKGDDFRLYQSFAMEASLVAYIIPSTFVSVFFVEFGYWPMVFIAIFFKVHWLRQQESNAASVPFVAVERNAHNLAGG